MCICKVISIEKHKEISDILILNHFQQSSPERNSFLKIDRIQILYLKAFNIIYYIVFIKCNFSFGKLIHQDDVLGFCDTLANGHENFEKAKKSDISNRIVS